MSTARPLPANPPALPHRFRDRRQAGELLAGRLAERTYQNALVVALPRGGVAVAAPVAERLGAPLAVLPVRKVGHPEAPEFALCAVAPDGHRRSLGANEASIDPVWLRDAYAREEREARRRAELFGAAAAPFLPAGREVILVDDGAATGLTFLLALDEVRERAPSRLVAALPVAPRATGKAIRRCADTAFILIEPADFAGAVGAYYEDFEQVSDETVIRLLKRANRA